MKTLSILTIALAVAACSGDKPVDSSNAPPAAGATTNPDEYRKQQQRFADSVLNSASSSSEVVQKLGDKYAVGSTMLRDSIAAKVAASNCLARGRDVDPYLSGTVTIWVSMSPIGSDIINTQESVWTSKAGDRVDACINEAAAKWKFDTVYGKPGAYIVQVQFKTAQ